MITLLNPTSLTGDRDQAPEYAFSKPVRCPDCGQMSDEEDGCPECRPCSRAGCTNKANPISEHHLCAADEYDGWLAELKESWSRLPLNFERTAECESQVRIWAALI